MSSKSSAGPRGARLPREVRSGLRAEARRLRGFKDPSERVVALAELLLGLSEEVELLAEMRVQAIAELRDSGLSYDRIAALTGISKARVAQLAATAGRTGRLGRRRKN